MKVKNLFELPLTQEQIHDGLGLCAHTTVFSETELSSPTRFINYTVLPVGATFGLHKHGNDNEFYLVLEGEGEYTADGETVKVHKGSLMVNEPYGTHGLKNTGICELKLLVFEVYNG